jgi:hypothetical protein
MKEILAVLIAVVVAGLALFYGGRYLITNFAAPSDAPVYNDTGNFDRKNITFNYENVDESETPSDSGGNSGIAPEVTPELMLVKIPLFREDSVVYIEYLVPKSPAVLNAVYTKLFKLNTNPRQSEFLTNTVAGSGLIFDSVTLSGGVAVLRLSGQYNDMHMGNFALRKQINAAAFQYSTVNNIEVYLKGKRFDWCITDLSDGEGGCPQTPRYWIDSK